MMSMFHRSHNTRVTSIKSKITKRAIDNHDPIYILEMQIQFGDWEQQTITVHGGTLESVIAKVSLGADCKTELAELMERDLVAYGNNLPMANPDVDDYENLPF